MPVPSLRPYYLSVFAIFGLLVLINYWPVFLGRTPLATDLIIQFPPYQEYQTPATTDHRHAELGDPVTQFYPWHALTGAAMRRGVLPLWDPYILAGRPFQANPLSALFYPLNLIFVVFPVGTAWALLLMAKVFLASIFTFIFLRSLGATTAGSLIGGAVFALGGYMTAWISWPQTDVALWLPLMCWCLQRLQQHASFRMAMLTAFVFAMPILAGHPGLAAFVLVAAVAHGLWTTRWSSLPDSSATLFWFTLAGLATLGLTAVQVLPSVEWLAQINRTLDTHWPALPLDNALAFFSRDMSRNPNSAGIHIPLGAAYVGALPLLAAALGLFHPNKRQVCFFFGLLIIGFGIAYGIPPIGALSQSLPILNGLKKDEALVLVDFSIAVLSGLGISRLAMTTTGRAAVFGTILAVTALCVWGTVVLGERTKFGAPDWWRAPGSFSLLLAVAAILVLLRVLNVASPKQWGLAAVALVAVDLVSFSYGHVPFNSPALAFPENRTHKFLSEHQQPFRYVSLNDVMLVNSDSAYGLSSPGGYDFMLQRLYLATYGLVADRLDGISFTVQTLDQGNPRIIDLLNIRFLVGTPINESDSELRTRPDRFVQIWSKDNVSIFENRTALPRAFLVPQSDAEVIPNDDAQLTRLRDVSFDPQKSVIVESRDGFSALPASSLIGDPQKGFEEYDQDFNWIRFKIEATTPSVLVLSQMHYPGWHVFIDGKPSPYLKVNYAFAGTLVDAGQHEIEFRYLPMRFQIGGMISLVSCLLAVCGIAWSGFTRKTSPSLRSE